MRSAQFVLGSACAGVVALAASPAWAATIRYDNGGSDNTWETSSNWVGDVLPGTLDLAEVSVSTLTGGSSLAVSISSVQNVNEVVIGHPLSSVNNVAGTTTLNVLPGAVLTVPGGGIVNSGMRIGRALNVGDALGSSVARVIQTGGTAQISLGSNGFRMSAADAGNVADSYYRVSDGIVRGDNDATGPALADLRVGATGSNFLAAEFHVLGSGPDEIRFLDVQVADSIAQVAASGGASGRSIFHWSLDNGGTTAILADDEFQFRSTSATTVGRLQVDINGAAEPPQSDITLVTADRLGNNGGALEAFSNFADGATLVATGTAWAYTYTVDYTDAGDNGILDASIVLHYVSREVIPEPGSLALLGLGGLAILRRRRDA
ncbi:MAG: PEP-CTERM sorting domain-containing protein [Tepidisphaeraceae bacterium]